MLEFEEGDDSPVRERWWFILRVVTPDYILVVRLSAKAFLREKAPEPTPYFEYNG